MLKEWTTHADYQQFLSSKLSSFCSIISERMDSFSDSISKLLTLNLDPLKELLEPYYSITGRPAIHQPEIFRSIILMLERKKTSLAKWVKKTKSDSFLAALIGCNPDEVPPLGSYYDFIDRLWLCDTTLDHEDRKRLLRFNKKPPKTKSPGKNKKLPNRHPGVTKMTADFFRDGRSFDNRFERLLQEIFALIAVEPSANLGLISKDNLTIAGDGTCVYVHSSSYGIKSCKCP